MKKILLLLGWMTTEVRLYKEYDNIHIYFGELNNQNILFDYVVGMSMGSLTILKNINKIDCKVILINPPLPKKNFFVWFVRLLKYIKNEGLFLERQKFITNPVKFIFELINGIKLISIDFSRTLDSLEKNKITVIRGKRDTFFCDEETVKFLRSKNIRVVEFEGGHNFCEAMEEAMSSLIV
jgi:hypothetical protein